MEENTQNDILLANRILLAGFTAFVSFLIWLGVLEVTKLGDIFGLMSYKIIFVLSCLNVVGVDRIYVKRSKREKKNT